MTVQNRACWLIKWPIGLSTFILSLPSHKLYCGATMDLIWLRQWLQLLRLNIAVTYNETKTLSYYLYKVTKQRRIMTGKMNVFFQIWQRGWRNTTFILPVSLNMRDTGRMNVSHIEKSTGFFSNSYYSKINTLQYLARAQDIFLPKQAHPLKFDNSSPQQTSIVSVHLWRSPQIPARRHRKVQ